MKLVELKTFSESEDLSQYISALNSAKVIHRLYEQSGKQVLLVHELQSHLAKEIYSDFLDGQLNNEPPNNTLFQKPSITNSIFLAIRVPVTSLLIVLSVGGFLLFHFNWWDLIYALVFQPTSAGGNTYIFSSASDAFLEGQVWRLITPIFLHFGTLHIVFNSLWCWELGKKIESNESSVNLAVLVFISALFSNFVQYHFSGPSIFGGMSGVIYGLLAYCGVTQWLMPKTKLAMPVAIYGIMLIFLVLGFTNIFSLVGMGQIANAAHVGGLLAGAFWALLVRKNTF